MFSLFRRHLPLDGSKKPRAANVRFPPITDIHGKRAFRIWRRVSMRAVSDAEDGGVSRPVRSVRTEDEQLYWSRAAGSRVHWRLEPCLPGTAAVPAGRYRSLNFNGRAVSGCSMPRIRTARGCDKGSNGSPDQSTRSASFPGSIDPTRWPMPNARAGLIVIAARATSRVSPWATAFPAP